MKVIITEDIINKAINESVNEFLINEKFGDAIKSVGNWVKNAAAMYMDWRTNGQWNNQFGIYANGNGRTTELYYLNKWFNFHLKEIKSAAQEMQNPNRAQTKLRWQRDQDGNEYATQTINNYNSIKEYAQQNINSANFNSWIKNYIKDRESLVCIDNYIDDNSNKIKDVNSAIKILNIGTFLNSEPYGKEYKKGKRENLAKSKAPDNTQQQIQQQTQMLQAYKDNYFPSLQKWINSLRGQNWYQTAYYNISNNNGISQDVKNWLLTIIGQGFQNGRQYVSSMITYNNFINALGKKYNQQAIQQVK